MKYNKKENQAIKLFEDVVNGVLNGFPEGKEELFELGKSIYKKHLIKTAPITLKEFILGEIKASGPIGMNTLVRECNKQIPGECGLAWSVWDVTLRLNQLLKAGEIELYDTGDCFINVLKEGE